MTLLLKELWALRFWCYFILLTQLLYLGFIVSSDFIDQQVLDVEETWLFFFSILIGLGSVASALRYEQKLNTQRFLDALPVSPVRVFFTKVLAALLITWSWIVLELGLALLLGYLSLTSIDSQLSFQYTGIMLLLGGVLGFGVVGIGSLLSFTGRWFAACTALLLWFGIRIQSDDFWWASAIDGVELLSPHIQDGRVISVSWLPLTGYFVFGGVCFIFAAWLYLEREGRLSCWLAVCQRKAWHHWLQKLSVLAAVLGWIAVFAWSFKKTIGENGESNDESAIERAVGTHSATVSPSDQAIGFGRHETNYCEFIFRNAERERSEAIWNVADRIYEEALTAFSNHGRVKGRIVVDLSAEVHPLAGAQAHWTKIRFPIKKIDNFEAQQHILRHEMTHVIIHQLSGRPGIVHFDSLRAFHEGMATYVELASPMSEFTRKRRKNFEKAAALAWSRGEVKLNQLLSSEALAQSRDELLVYPLGLVFVECLIEIGGADMPRLLMTTLASKPPPSGTEGMAVWQHLFRLTGHSWEQVNASYEGRMAALLEMHRPLIDQLPRLSASVQRKGSQVVVCPNPVNAPPGFEIVCLVESDLGLLSRKKLELSSDGCFQMPFNIVAQGRVRFLLGWADSATRISFYEPWSESTIPLVE